MPGDKTNNRKPKKEKKKPKSDTPTDNSDFGVN